MKSGKKLIQIPIQSLNTVHAKSYDFDFNPEVFKYHLGDEELDEIQLVLQSGEKFEFPDEIFEEKNIGRGNNTSKSPERKRDKKQKEKD